MSAAAEASSELGYQFGIFEVICLCRRRQKKKYQLKEGEWEGGGAGQGGGSEEVEEDGATVSEERYRAKRSVVVRNVAQEEPEAHAHDDNMRAHTGTGNNQQCHNHAQNTEVTPLDEDRLKVMVDKFKQNINALEEEAAVDSSAPGGATSECYNFTPGVATDDPNLDPAITDGLDLSPPPEEPSGSGCNVSPPEGPSVIGNGCNVLAPVDGGAMDECNAVAPGSAAAGETISDVSGAVVRVGRICCWYSADTQFWPFIPFGDPYVEVFGHSELVVLRFCHLATCLSVLLSIRPACLLLFSVYPVLGNRSCATWWAGAAGAEGVYGTGRRFIYFTLPH